MKKIICGLISLLFLTSFMNLNAQWARTYGKYDDDVAYSIQQTSDGGYIVVGHTASYGTGDNDFDAWIIKLFSTGAVEWQRTFGGPEDDSFEAVQETSDGGYIVAGYTESFGAGYKDLWVLKLTSTGDVEWQWAYGGSAEDYDFGGNPDDFARSTSIKETSDGGYIVGGCTQSFDVERSDVWILKLTASGAIEWQKTYGYPISDEVYSILETGDGGYLAVGTSPEVGFGVGIIKLTPTGDIEWQRDYGGNNSVGAGSMQQTSDGGYVVVGSIWWGFTAGYDDVWILKLTATGDIEWQKAYGGSKSDGAHSIKQTSDGGYIVAGSTLSFGAGYRDAWVIKLTSNGSIEWERTFGGSYGGEIAHSIEETDDGGYIAAGYTNSFGAGGFDILVFKLDSSGDIDPSCEFIGNSAATITDTSASWLEPGPYIKTQDTDIKPAVTIANIKNTGATVNLHCGSPKFVMKISSGYGGTTDPSPGSHLYDPGTGATITAMPAFGYSFLKWTGNVPDGYEYDNPLTILMDSDKSIVANFVVNAGNYELTINKTPNGTTDPAPGIYCHPNGTQVCITAFPDSGNSFLYWGGDVPAGYENDNPLCLTMDSNKVITPHFGYPGKLWTFMVYLDGDNGLESSSIDDFLEMAMVGSDANINIVVQLDRIQDNDARYGGWTSTKRFYVTTGLSPTAENAFEDHGEVNMGDAQALASFISWAKASFPADNYALILWNGGAGWRFPCLDSTSEDELTMEEVQSALSSNGGAQLIGFDAALMGMMEVAYEIRNYGEVMVASEENEPLAGWPYTPILQDLAGNPYWTATELGTAIVNRYYESYYDIYTGSKQTLSAVDLKKMHTLASTISLFAQTMIDSWSADPTAVKNAAQALMTKIENTVIHERHDSSQLNAHGLAIYFPEVSDEFDSNYTAIQLDFPADTQWNEFLQEFHNSMSGSWIAQRRAASQCFFYLQNVDLHNFCEMINIVQEDYYTESLIPHEYVGGGTAQIFREDDCILEYKLPFDFPFFGEIIPEGKTLYICSNGWVDFTYDWKDHTEYDYTNSGYEMLKRKRIALCWTDLTTAGGHQSLEDIYITETPSSLIIRWVAEMVITYNPVNTELILYSDGRIQFNYDGGNTDLSHWLNGQGPTIGISKGDGTNFYFSAHNAKKTLANAESVIFAPPVSYFNLTIAGSAGGTTDPSPGTYSYSQGTELTVNAIPDTGYRFKNWTGDVPSGHEMDNPLTISIDSSKSITANFIRQYTLTISAGTGGTTDPSPGTYNHDSGTQVTIKAIANSGYEFTAWSGSATSSTNPLTITMDSNKSITANFRATGGGGGDGGGGDTGKKGGCFIATAAYGSSFHPHVKILRAFRDKCLMSSRFGRSLVKLYYRYSPFIADLIERNDTLKTVVRISILPFVAFSYSVVKLGLI